MSDRSQKNPENMAQNPENSAQIDHKQELDKREDQELSIEELDAVAGGIDTLPGQSAPAK